MRDFGPVLVMGMLLVAVVTVALIVWIRNIATYTQAMAAQLAELTKQIQYLASVERAKMSERDVETYRKRHGQDP